MAKLPNKTMRKNEFVFDPAMIAEHLRRVFIQNQEPFPLRLTLGLTRKCNLSCIFCWRSVAIEKDWKEIQDEDLLRLIDQAAKLGVKIVHIQGEGEPFFRGELCLKLMEKAKSRGLAGCITTNATLINEAMAERIVNCGWDEINVSIYAPEYGLHDNFRGMKGVFEKAVATVGLIERLKREYMVDKPELRVLYVVNALNYKLIPQMLGLLKKLNLTRITFFPLTVYSDAAKNIALSQEDRQALDEIARSVESAAEYADIKHNLGSFRLQSAQLPKANTAAPGIRCFLPWYNISISAEGFADCCDMTLDREIKYPDVSLEEIWNSSYYKRFRSGFSSGETFEKCAHCCMEQDNENIRRSLAGI